MPIKTVLYKPYYTNSIAMKKIDLYIQHNFSGELTIEDKNYIFNYTQPCDNSHQASLTMPVRMRSYQHNELFPIFEMNLPEGYLFEIFKNILQKQHGEINNFTLLAYLGSSSHGRLSYQNNFLAPPENQHSDTPFTKQDVLNSDDNDLFSRLLTTFLSRTIISGMQPKVVAPLTEKANLTTDEYIIKSWGDAYPCLSENEHFCLKAAQRAGLKTVNFSLSENRKLLLVKRFDTVKNGSPQPGFEEVCVLQGKNKSQKYLGSYEQVIKTIETFTSEEHRQISIRETYKNILLSFILRNGDAHLKNFGILYSADLTDRYLAPAYDIVNTTTYLPKDTPALTLFGKKLWWGRKQLIKFGTEQCKLFPQEAEHIYQQCMTAMQETRQELIYYINNTPEFADIGNKIVSSWKTSESAETIKDISHELH